MKRWLGSLLALTFGAIACADTVTTPGQLVLSFQTDMRLPEDTDSVRIVITRFGKSEFDQTYEVGGDGRVKIPATLGVVAGSNPSDPIKISLTAILNKKPQVLREIVTTIPSTRIATLRVPFQWLCYGERSITGDSVETAVNTCGEGKTCVAGSCQTQEVDSSLLPDFKEVEIFGGGTSNGDGKCFDTAAVFPASLKGTVPTLVGDTCSISKPSGDESLLNVAIRLRAGASTCPLGECVVPFDRDLEAGWSIVGSNVVLPKKACELFNAGKLDVIASLGAPSKTLSLPMCGPWSSANTSASPGVSVKDATTTTSSGDGGTSNAETLVDDTGAKVTQLVLADRALGPVVFYLTQNAVVKGFDTVLRLPVNVDGGGATKIASTPNHLLFALPVDLGGPASYINACHLVDLTSPDCSSVAFSSANPLIAGAANGVDSQVIWTDPSAGTAKTISTASGAKEYPILSTDIVDLGMTDSTFTWVTGASPEWTVHFGGVPGDTFPGETSSAKTSSFMAGSLKTYLGAAFWKSSDGRVLKATDSDRDRVTELASGVTGAFAPISTGIFISGYGNTDGAKTSIHFVPFETGTAELIVSDAQVVAMSATENEIIFATEANKIKKVSHKKGASQP